MYLHFGDHDTFLLPRNKRAGRGRAGAAPDVAAGAAPCAPAPTSSVTSLVDHFAIKIQDWDTDKVEGELKRRGLTPSLDTGGPNDPKDYASFHVKDPDGFNLQISGTLKPGDRLYGKKG